MNKSIRALKDQGAVEVPGAPVVTVPKPTQWLYVQSTGGLYRPDGSFCAQCYSGREEGLNNPAMQQVKDVGPLPVGIYGIGTVDEEKGPLTIHLTPDPANTMFGRSGFLIHGDNHLANHTASEGCIVAPNGARYEISSAGGTIRVMAKPASTAETIT